MPLMALAVLDAQRVTHAKELQPRLQPRCPTAALLTCAPPAEGCPMRTRLLRCTPAVQLHLRASARWCCLPPKRRQLMWLQRVHTGVVVALALPSRV